MLVLFGLRNVHVWALSENGECPNFSSSLSEKMNDGEDWELFSLLSHILGDTIHQTHQLGRIPEMVDHLVSIHMVSQENQEVGQKLGAKKSYTYSSMCPSFFPYLKTMKNHNFPIKSHDITIVVAQKPRKNRPTPFPGDVCTGSCSPLLPGSLQRSSWL